MFSPDHRRQFLKRFVVGTTASILGGKLWSGRVLGALLDGPPGVLNVKVSEYPALQSIGGSIQLSFADLAYPLLVNRGPNNAFYAMDSDCQHLNCVVPPYNHAEGQIRCGCHGSRYAIDGSRIGGPTTRGLNTFATSYDGADTVSVTIPGLKFSVTQISVQSTTGSTRRLRLQTNIRPYTRYRVTFQRQLTDAPEYIPFATTPTGPANSVSGYTTNSPLTVYVDATGENGFYTIALVAVPYV